MMQPKKVKWTYRITDEELELTEYYGSAPYTKEVSTLSLETGASDLGRTAKRVLESAVSNSEAPEDVASNTHDLAPSYFLKRAITSDEPLVQRKLSEHGYGCEFVEQGDGYRAELPELEVHVALPADWRGEGDGQE